MEDYVKDSIDPQIVGIIMHSLTQMNKSSPKFITELTKYTTLLQSISYENTDYLKDQMP